MKIVSSFLGKSVTLPFKEVVFTMDLVMPIYCVLILYKILDIEGQSYKKERLMWICCVLVLYKILDMVRVIKKYSGQI